MTLLERLRSDIVLQHEIIAEARRTGTEWPWFPFRGIPYAVHVKYRKENPKYARMVDRAKAAHKRERDLEDVRIIFAGKTIPITKDYGVYEFERNRNHGLIPAEEMVRRYTHNKKQPIGTISDCTWCNRPFQKQGLRDAFCSLNCRVYFHRWKKGGQTWKQDI